MKQQHYNIQRHSIQPNNFIKIFHLNIYQCDDPISDLLSSHSYPRLIYFSNGSGNISIKNNCYSVNEKDLFIMNQGICPITINSVDTQLDIIVLGVSNILFSDNASTIYHDYLHYTINDEVSLFIMKQLLQEVTQETDSMQKCYDNYLNLLMVYLNRNFGLKYQVATKDTKNKDCEFIRNYLDEHYTENITLDLLAQKSNTNKYYLVHSFSKNYGCSPINYLNEKKIKESKILLRTTNYSVADIAKMIGFSSQSYFSQSFKKHTFMTPNEYRRSTR